jgi:hypothetical protein
VKKILFTAGILLILICGQALALHYSVVGGFRGGMAFGLISEYHFTQNIALRFGLEGTTGSNPLILSLGAHILNIQPIPGVLTPWFIGVGLVSYSGNNSSVGGSTFIIYDPLEKDNPLFFEVGADFLDSPRIVAQVGYYLISDDDWR